MISLRADLVKLVREGSRRFAEPIRCWVSEGIQGWDGEYIHGNHRWIGLGIQRVEHQRWQRVTIDKKLRALLLLYRVPPMIPAGLRGWTLERLGWLALASGNDLPRSELALTMDQSSECSETGPKIYIYSHSFTFAGVWSRYESGIVCTFWCLQWELELGCLSEETCSK